MVVAHLHPHQRKRHLDGWAQAAMAQHSAPHHINIHDFPHIEIGEGMNYEILQGSKAKHVSII